MKLEDHIAAWNYAAVKVLDIRHAARLYITCMWIYLLCAGGGQLESQRYRLRRRPSFYRAWWQGYETKRTENFNELLLFVFLNTPNNTAKIKTTITKPIDINLFGIIA